MERLSREKRKEFMKRAIDLNQDTYVLGQIRGLLSSDIYEIELKELLVRKYRMITCIKLLSEFGMGERFEDMDLIGVFDALEAVESMDEDDIDVLYEFIYGVSSGLNESYMLRCLSDTEWEIHMAEVLEDYEELDDDVIRSISGIIGAHWYMLEDYYSNDTDNDSERLRSLGCEPNDDHVKLYTDYNLILTNRSVEKMLDICGKHKEYQGWEEYKELSQIQEFLLFDRYFPYEDMHDLKQSNWKCISYLLGRVAESEEEVSMQWLKYESVLYLMLADMIAKAFLERYQSLEVQAA